jgi:hypothetical protein
MSAIVKHCYDGHPDSLLSIICDGSLMQVASKDDMVHEET